MEKILSILLEEFSEALPGTTGSIQRELDFPDVPGMINVAIGIRRSGKTYLIYQKIRELVKAGISLERILFVNFEDDRLLPMDQKELGRLLDAFYTLYPKNHDRECYLFLDEIQNVEGWPLVIRRFFDSKKVRIYLTGSSAKLLSKEISTSLRGRSIATEVWPYSFQEYWGAQKIDTPNPPFGKKKLDQFYQHFLDYFKVGGFPTVQRLNTNERRTVLQSHVDTVIFRDIIERYKVANSSLVKYLIKTLIKNVASPFTVHKFYKDIKSQGFKVSKDTVYQYLDYLEDAFLILTVPLFTESVRKMQVNPKKIYIVDNGLVCAQRLGISLKLGNLFENQVYLDLRRQGKKVRYFLTKEGYEIDFVVEGQDGSIELLQVVWDVGDPRTLEREKRALEHAEKELGIKGRIVTPQDYISDSLKKI
ncbi:Uncharacterized protein MJ1544 [Chlamydiales bacterium SCGC AG-110-M15]|nr:Uncharacterized protein MJ1544 [Chlamydiales bacterium SCGC AG-110-M15]